MALTPGSRLGPYEVTALLGEGGMGQVYRATDTNLKRQVAIKVLPASVAGDADRLARFQREAEVLAALNHPHIAAIYGLEKTPDLTALVMELVEGEDLSQRIARLRAPGASARQAGMPLDEALPIAKQIAEALEAAHEQGIIHRDLKPANIKVRADGTVKVLDFGLAKAIDANASSATADAMNSPTITSPAMTQAGMILGTAAYMAPEQARGKAVDRRADIWAFGAVLYEMLTGTRAFEGEDIADTLGNVMKVEPNWQRLPASMPPRVVQVVRACLQKDPRQRMGDVQSVRLALEGAFDAAGSQTTVVAPSSSGRRLAWVVAAIAVLGMVALALPAVRHLRETPPPETRLDISTPTTYTPTAFALSPDGRQIVFAAAGDGAPRLWLRSVETTLAQPLAGTEGGLNPFWSPDSRSIGFFAGGVLKRLDLGAGAPQALVLVPGGGRGGTWNRDGVIVFASGLTTPLFRVPATGGAAVPVTALGSQLYFMPSFLPDGHRLLFSVANAKDANGIYLGTLEGGAPVRLTQAATAGAYLPSGWLLWVRTDTLVAQRLDVEKAALTGTAVTVADGVADAGAGASPVSVAATGLVAYRTGGIPRRQLTWVDRSGATQRPFGDSDGDGLLHPRVSPDGSRVVVSRTVDGNTDLWLLDGARTSRLTFDAARDDFPIWSADGARIGFRSNRAGSTDLYQRLTSGAGAEERLAASDLVKTPTSWSSDGRFLLYQSTDPQTSSDLWVVPMVGDREPVVFLKTPFREALGAFSPDGRWVAYQSNASGRDEIYVRPFVPPGATGTASDGAGGQWQVSTTGGISPVWRPDGKELFYLDPAGAMMAASITATGATLAAGAPVRLFPTLVVYRGTDRGSGQQYDVTRDGRFLINAELPGDAAPITLIQNWDPEAKR